MRLNFPGNGVQPSLPFQRHAFCVESIDITVASAPTLNDSACPLTRFQLSKRVNNAGVLVTVITAVPENEALAQSDPLSERYQGLPPGPIATVRIGSVTISGCQSALSLRQRCAAPRPSISITVPSTAVAKLRIPSEVNRFCNTQFKPSNRLIPPRVFHSQGSPCSSTTTD